MRIAMKLFAALLIAGVLTGCAGFTMTPTDAMPPIGEMHTD